ncbi:hypothetical protein OSB04_010535 [Centaurea solstitialis]|uniref:Uncharacterized protein n=1 Tax=Centaurea solstitialis TaxID=347529 RepID=A0AA38WPG1_9ASTR|nr:hypothetical protein OSB04_010535 [Centaurea solstitialis]
MEWWFTVASTWPFWHGQRENVRKHSIKSLVAKPVDRGPRSDYGGQAFVVPVGYCEKANDDAIGVSRSDVSGHVGLLVDDL